jgi:hypothetical protein
MHTRIAAVHKVAIARGLVALGRGLIAIGSRLIAIGSRLIAIGSRLIAIGSRLIAIGCRLVSIAGRIAWRHAAHNRPSQSPSIVLTARDRYISGFLSRAGIATDRELMQLAGFRQ